MCFSACSFLSALSFLSSSVSRKNTLLGTNTKPKLPLGILKLYQCPGVLDVLIISGSLFLSNVVPEGYNLNLFDTQSLVKVQKTG
jgi:hypothetical protein